MSTHPTLYADFLAIFCALEHINNLSTFHFYTIHYSLFTIHLLVSSHTQAVNLLLGQVAPVATLQVLLGETCELNAVELLNAIAQALEDTANDTVLT